MLTLALGTATFVAVLSQRGCCAGEAGRRCDFSRQPYRFVTGGDGSGPETWRLEARSADCPLRDLAGALAGDSWPHGNGRQLIIMIQGDRCACMGKPRLGQVDDKQGDGVQLGSLKPVSHRHARGYRPSWAA